MELEQAYRLLHIETGDSEKQIRAKYHLAVRKYHPDASKLDADKALEMTKQLNAAFTLVMKHIHSDNGYPDNLSCRRHSNSSDSGERRSSSSSFSGTPGGSASSSSASGSSNRSSYAQSGSDRNRYSWQPFDEAAFYRQSAHNDAGAGRAETNAYSAPIWPAEVNPAAFCDRTIYAIGDLFSSMGWFAEENAYGAPGDPVNDPDDFYESDYLTRPRAVASGKYYWDPDYESFPMFLYSIHQKCKALMQSEVIDPMLLHFLALEFIRPWECLAKIADDYPDIKVISPKKSASERRSHGSASEGGQGTGQPAYQIEGRLCLNSASRMLFEKYQGASLPFSAEIVREQIHLMLPSGEDLGHLSFEADPLYYILLMILRAGKGQIIIRVKESDSTQHGSIHHGSAENGNLRLLILLTSPDLSPGGRKDYPENHHFDIARLLNSSALTR